MNWKKFIFLALMATVPSFADLTEEISDNIIPGAISINANGQGPFLALTNQNYIMLTSNQSSMPGISVETTTEVTYLPEGFCT